jgi:hypothetical protein
VVEGVGIGKEAMERREIGWGDGVVGRGVMFCGNVGKACVAATEVHANESRCDDRRKHWISVGSMATLHCV